MNARLGTQAVGEAAAGASSAVERRTLLRASAAERMVQGLVGAVLAGALALGLAVTPSPDGTGTHTILGLPPCGMLVATGRPCPTCGVTTSFVLAVHGRFGDALVNQPFGLAVFFLVFGGLALAVATLLAGRSWLPLLTPYRVGVAVGALLVLAVVSWAYKWATI